MSVDIVRLRRRLPGSHSLKGKRQAIKSIIAPVRDRFNVSVAERHNHDHRQVATLGVSCVSAQGRQMNQAPSRIVEFISLRACPGSPG